jgi:Asp-tRNA(Asn)/Glu-tRNA(Gln) amidotransferase C subunit
VALGPVPAATCALGFGTLTASGDGTQPGAKGAPTGGGGGTGAPPAAKGKPPAPADLLQGLWRVTSITENGNATKTRDEDPWVIEIRGATFTMPYQEAGAWKKRAFGFKAGTDGLVGTFEISTEDKRVRTGIYEFTVPQQTCAKCHSGTVNVPAAFPADVCAPALQALALKSGYGVRFALPIDGKRPATFSDNGSVVFEMQRERIDPDKAAALEDLLRERAKRAQLEAERAALEAQTRDRDKLRALVEQLAWLSELKATAEEAKQLRLRMEEVMKRLDQIPQQLLDAQLNVARAKEDLAHLEQTRARLLAEYHEAQALLAALQKKAEAAKPAPKVTAAGATFTVHIRTMTAAEKVVKVKATGNETILEAIVYAADDVPVKSDAVSVWIVRGKEVLPVDLPAILKNGEVKTN